MSVCGRPMSRMFSHRLEGHAAGSESSDGEVRYARSRLYLPLRQRYRCVVMLSCDDAIPLGAGIEFLVEFAQIGAAHRDPDALAHPS